MHLECQIRSGALQWIDGLRRFCDALLSESKPHRVHMAACSVFSCVGVTEADGFNQMFVFLSEDSSVRKGGVASELM